MRASSPLLVTLGCLVIVALFSVVDFRNVTAVLASQDPDGIIKVQVHPRNAPVTSMVSQQFTATVDGANNQQVTWYVDGQQGGNQQVGTIDMTGTYTPPQQFSVGTHVVKAVSQENPKKSAQATAWLTAFAGNYTHKYDHARDGANLQETILTPDNVSEPTFGKIFEFQTGKIGIHAQPLYAANVNIPHPLNGDPGYHNVLYTVTEDDSVFAFDADGKVTKPLWFTSFINPPNVVPVPGACFHSDFSEFGITATPVIDPDTQTIYIEARTLENPTDQCKGTFIHRLHALDITSGAEKFGGPVVVQGSIPGTGDDSQNGILAFNPKMQNVRPGLLLLTTNVDTNKVVFFGSASLEDQLPFHGWILGYDSQTLQQKYIYCTSPNGAASGIWQMGAGLAADSQGRIYAQTGNGSFDGRTEFGSSVLKLNPTSNGLTLTDFFAPKNVGILNKRDWDVSSGGLLILPDQAGKFPHLMVGGGKEGTIYVLNRDKLGKYHKTNDRLAQEIVGAIRASGNGGIYGIWNSPSYFNNMVYIFGRDYPKMFQLQNGMLPTTATSTGTVQMRAPNPIISANGTTNGIVWAVQFEISPPKLWAFNPMDLTQEYYDSEQNYKRDHMRWRVDATDPLVANGRVYVATREEIDVYGLLQ